MSVHVDAITAVLDGTVYDTDVSVKPTLPYYVVEAPNFATEQTTLDARDVNDLFRIRAVAASTTEVRDLLEAADDALDGKRLAPTGFSAYVERIGSAFIAVDRDVKLPGIGFVAFGVDTYRYRATATGITGS